NRGDDQDDDGDGGFDIVGHGIGSDLKCASMKLIRSAGHTTGVTRGLVPRVPIVAKTIGVAGTSPATPPRVWVGPNGRPINVSPPARWPLRRDAAGRRAGSA